MANDWNERRGAGARGLVIAVGLATIAFAPLVLPQAASSADVPRDAAATLAATVATIYSVAMLALTIYFAGKAYSLIRNTDEWPEIETHWGGLGGGLGGIRISPALLCLLAAIAFGAMLSASVQRTVEALHESVKNPVQQPSESPLSTDDEETPHSPSAQTPTKGATGSPE